MDGEFVGYQNRDDGEIQLEFYSECRAKLLAVIEGGPPGRGNSGENYMQERGGMTTDTEIAVAGEYSAHQREILLETVAKGCSPEQFMLMLELAKRYRLDPFARQIWATPAGIFVGRDGFLALAHASGNFDGMETAFEERDGKLFSATCTVYHKKMQHPIRLTVRFDEFNRPNSDAWRRMPYVMLQKCAEAHALRRAFCVTGLYDEAEFPPEGPARGVFASTATVDGEPVPVERMSGRCSRCGLHDPMVDAFRERYRAAFEEAGLVLPEGVCEECAKELWKHGEPQ